MVYFKNAINIRYWAECIQFVTGRANTTLAEPEELFGLKGMQPID